MKIQINDLGECVSACKFDRNCACHHTAGDYRIETGFTPEVTDSLNCISADADVNSFNEPKDATVGTGWIPLHEGTVETRVYLNNNAIWPYDISM